MPIGLFASVTVVSGPLRNRRSVVSLPSSQRPENEKICGCRIGTPVVMRATSTPAARSCCAKASSRSSAMGSFAITRLNLIQNRRRTLSRSCASLSAGSNPTLCSDVAIAFPSRAHAADRRGHIFSWGSKIPAASGLMHAELAGDAVHGLGQLDIEPGDAAGIMGGQHHLHGLVDIAPFRVMVVFLGDKCCPRHEAERLVEILEGE